MVSLVLVGRMAFAAHLLLVPHDMCQHGKIVHLHDHRSVDAATTLPAERTLGVHESDPGEGSHDHCDLLGIHEVPPSATAPPVPGDHLSWLLVPATPPSATGFSSVPLLMLAPKQSPPRA